MADTGYGDRLRQARRELAVRLRRDVTQAHVGDAVGVSGVTVSRYESGLAEPTLAMFVKLAAALGVSPGHLAFGELATQVPEAPKAHRPAGQPHHGTPAPRGSGKAREQEPGAARRSSGGRRRA